MREKIATIDNYDLKIIRISDTFVIYLIFTFKDFVCDIEADKLEEFKVKAEKHELSVEVLSSLPNLYINPFAEKYKTFNNVESSKHNNNEKQEITTDNLHHSDIEKTYSKNSNKRSFKKI